MGKIIACIDGSHYADYVCSLSSWVSRQTGLPITLLHVVVPHSDVATIGDFSGSLGLNTNIALLEKLTKLDEEHGKLEQKKGQLMLEHAKSELAKQKITHVETKHRRGALVETIIDLEEEADIIIIGKRGEHAETAPHHLGSNLERVARALHKPLLVATKNIPAIKRFMIAFDGSASTYKAIDYIIKNTLLKGLECHIVMIGDLTDHNRSMLKFAKEKFEAAAFEAYVHIRQGNPVEELISYISEHDIHLMAIGAYGHSKIRNLILGSTTTALLRKSHIPGLLFR